MTSKNDLVFYLSIIDSVKSHHKLPTLSCSKQARNYYVRKLKIGGVINKTGYGVWEINQDQSDRFLFKEQVKKEGQDTRSEVKGQVKNMRGHGFSFTLRISMIKGWGGRSQFLGQKGIAYKQIRVGYGNGQSMVFKGYRVWLLDKSVVVIFPKGMSLWTRDAQSGYDLAFFKVKQLISSLESFLGVSFVMSGDYKLKLSKQGYGDVDNLLARQFDDAGQKLRVRHAKYGEWLLLDASKPGEVKYVEAETVQPNNAHIHMDKVVKPLFDDLGKYAPEHFNDILDLSERSGKPVLISEVWEAINQVTKNQGVFAANLVSHVEAVQSLSEGVKELRDTVKDLKQEEPEKRKESAWLEGLRWKRIIP
jgi:hypothetical protein